MPVGTTLLDPCQALHVKQHPCNNAVFMARNGPKHYGHGPQTSFVPKRDTKSFHIRFEQALKRLNNLTINEQNLSFKSSCDIYSSNNSIQNRKDDGMLTRSINLNNCDGILLPPVVLKRVKKKIYRTSMFHNLSKLSQNIDSDVVPPQNDKEDTIFPVSENDDQVTRTDGLCPPPSPSAELEQYFVQLSQKEVEYKPNYDGQVPYRLPALSNEHLFDRSVKHRCSGHTKHNNSTSSNSNSELSNYLYSLYK
ncbi:unnamed protein product [Didymodactylos carnosus]|uniref:Uncharacterized protein n=1 Tax=Didymodactylos carnosus TaxID=1234261 RepID=A0A815LV96_9BILA|nr:unnamed protein product [Didymodactylos carnosus]CAF1409195.1 unnamed protein product [Didymodactylos carnosus]CAF4137422.1 unnamed protein product [Didymodactylos carnosus]CAF4298815.1 unnamed protein product [Didymodactylos carnosus]